MVRIAEGIIMKTRMEQLLNEVQYRFSRSSGSGGQNVNKVATRVELIFSVADSAYLSDTEKERIKAYLKNRINKEGELLLASQQYRTQSRNRMEVNRLFRKKISQALQARKKRKGPPVLRANTKKRLQRKKRRSEIKQSRKRVIL
jgi:ribosome-associated protein